MSEDAKGIEQQRNLDAVLNVALEAGKIAEDVRLVAANPMHLPGKVGGIGSLATSVELLSAAVAELAKAAMTK